jgi:hypothetical protein
MAAEQERAGWRQCFVIAPIGAEKSETRIRSDKILRHVIRPVVEERGYVAVRGDEIDRAGLITTQVLDRIISDELVIADLTDQNANVFYELAVRHALRRPFVQIMAQDQQLPFDVQGMRTITIDLTDLDNVAHAKELLGKAIDALEHSGDIITPMSVALSLQELRGGSTAEETSLSQIMQVLPTIVDMLQDVRRDVALSAGAAEDGDDYRRLRRLVEALVDRGSVTEDDLGGLLSFGASLRFEKWVQDLIRRVGSQDH